MADTQPAIDELIRGILRSVDPAVPANADEFGKVAFAALEKVNTEAREIAETHLPQVSNTLAEHVSQLATLAKAVLAYRETVIAQTSATERFNGARSGHATAQGVAKMCDDQGVNARKVQLEVDRQIARLAATRAAVGEFITTGCGIVAAQTGAEPPAPDSYAGRLTGRLSALQNAFTQATAIQKTLNDRRKTLASGLDLLGDVSIGIAAADVDFLKFMNPPEPKIAATAEPASSEEKTPGEPASPPSSVPDAAELADIILGAQAKAAGADPQPTTSTALMVIPRQPEPGS